MLKQFAIPPVNTMRTEAGYLKAYLNNYRAYVSKHNRRVGLFNLLRWYGPWRLSLCHGRSPVADRVPWVVFGAKEYLSRLIKRGCNVFEYGMGGSTLFFLDSGCHLISVEHDSEWGQRLSLLIGNIQCWSPVIIKPKKLLKPDANSEYRSSFPGYEDSDFEDYVRYICMQPDDSLDIVMIDGRARSSALAIAVPKVAPSGVIVLDNAERDRYADDVNKILAQGWHEKRLFGPGPYVRNEYWDTTFLFKPPFQREAG
jgi:hypothetical protein